MTDWQALEKKYYMHTIVRIPLTLVRGEGSRVWDDRGNEYLDFVGGMAVDCLGHSHPVIVKALAEQARTLIQASNWYYTIPAIQLAQLLVENSCCDRAFICNSGLEANEGAIKLARRYGHLKLNGAYEIITALDSFHGRSLALTAASGQPKMHQPYIPLPAGFINVPNNDIDAIRAATTEKTCAVMVEPVQGEGGVNLPAEGYLTAVREWCDRRGILLILDEIQTGIGRLGELFGYQVFGIEPDIMSLAKGLGGGIPIGAVLAKARADVFAPGDHNSTFGGNPVTSAAACAVLKYVIENNVPGNAKKVGQYLLTLLAGLKKKYPVITEVRGAGLLVAVQFDGDIAQQVLMACLKEGLLVNCVRPNAIRLVPPLIIGQGEVDRAIGMLDKALSGMR